jgi:hypothetical protein
MPGEGSAVPTEDRVGLNHLQTSPPTGPVSRQHNPQESVAAVEAQATRGVLLENRQLVTQREDLRLQGRTGSKTGGYQTEKVKRELIVVSTMISRLIGTSLFSDRTEFSVTTTGRWFKSIRPDHFIPPQNH